MSEVKKKIAETREKISEIPALAVNIRNDIYKAIQSAQGIMQESSSLRDVIELAKLSISAVSNGSYLDSTVVNFFKHYDYVGTELNLMHGFVQVGPAPYSIQQHQVQDNFTWDPATRTIGNTAAYFPTNEAIFVRETSTTSQVRIKKDVNRNFGTGCKFLCTLYNVDSTYQFLLTDGLNDTETKIEADGTSNTFSTYFGNYYFCASRDTGKLLGPNDFADLDVVIGPNVNLDLGSDFDFGHVDLTAEGVPSIKDQILNQESWNSKYRKVNINKATNLSSTFPDGNSVSVTKSWMYPLLVELDPLGENFQSSLVDGSTFASGVNYAYLKTPQVNFSNNGYTTATIRSSVQTLTSTDAIQKKISLQEFAPSIGDVLFVKRAVADIHGDVDTLFAIAVVVAPGTQLNTDWLPVGDNAGVYTDTNFNNSNGASSQKMTTYSDEKFLNIIGSSWNGSSNNGFTQLNKQSFSGLDNSTLANGYSYTGVGKPLAHDTYALNPYKPYINEGFGNLQPQILADFGYNLSKISRSTTNAIVENHYTTVAATLGDNDAFIGNYHKFTEANTSWTQDRISYYVNQAAKYYKLPRLNQSVNEQGIGVHYTLGSDITDWYPGDYQGTSAYTSDANNYFYWYKEMPSAGSTTDFNYSNWYPHAPYSLKHDSTANTANNYNMSGHFLRVHPVSYAPELRPYDNLKRLKGILDFHKDYPTHSIFEKLNWSCFNFFAGKNYYSSFENLPALFSSLYPKGTTESNISGYGPGGSALAAFTSGYKTSDIRYRGHYQARFHFAGYWYGGGGGSARTYTDNPNNFYVLHDLRMVHHVNRRYYLPNGQTGGSSPGGRYVRIRFGSGTDTEHDWYIGGYNISSSVCPNFSGSNTSVTRKFYHYALNNTGDGYVRLVRYHTKVTARATNAGSWGYYQGNCSWATKPSRYITIYYNVVWTLDFSYGEFDLDITNLYGGFIGPFHFNALNSAIRGDGVMKPKEGSTGTGASTVSRPSIYTGNTTMPFGNTDFKTDSLIESLSKHVYCDAMFESPYDALHLTQIEGNTAWNDLSGSATPQYIYRRWANSIANCMMTETIATINSSPVFDHHGQSSQSDGYDYNQDDLPLSTANTELAKEFQVPNAIKMGFGTGQTTTGNFRVTIQAPTSPTGYVFPQGFVLYSASTEVDLETQLGFLPTGLEITDIKFRGDLRGTVETTPGTYVGVFYSGAFSDIYSGTYQQVYAGSYTDTYTDVFTPSAGYSNNYSSTFGSSTGIFTEGIYSGILAYSQTYTGVYSVSSYIPNQYYAGPVYSATTAYSGVIYYTDFYSGAFADPYVSGVYYSQGFEGTASYSTSVGFVGAYAGNYSSGPTVDVNVYSALYSAGFADYYSRTTTDTFIGYYSSGLNYTGSYEGTYSRGFEGEGLYYAGTQTIYDEKLQITLGEAGVSLGRVSFDVGGLNDDGERSATFKSSGKWASEKDNFKLATDDYTDVMSNNRKNLKITVQPTIYVNSIPPDMDRVWEIEVYITGTRFDQEPGAEVFTLPASTYREYNVSIGSKFKADQNPRFTRVAERLTQSTQYWATNLYSHWFTNNGDSNYKRLFAYNTNNAPFGRLGGIYDYFVTPINDLIANYQERYIMLQSRVGYPLYEESDLSILTGNTSLSSKKFFTVKYIEGVTQNNDHLAISSGANTWSVGTKFANVTPYGTFYYNLINFNLEGDHPITAYSKKLEILTFPNDQLAELRNFYELLNGRLKQTYDDTDPT